MKNIKEIKYNIKNKNGFSIQDITKEDLENETYFTIKSNGIDYLLFVGLYVRNWTDEEYVMRLYSGEGKDEYLYFNDFYYNIGITKFKEKLKDNLKKEGIVLNKGNIQESNLLIEEKEEGNNEQPFDFDNDHFYKIDKLKNVLNYINKGSLFIENLIWFVNEYSPEEYDMSDVRKTINRIKEIINETTDNNELKKLNEIKNGLLKIESQTQKEDFIWFINEYSLEEYDMISNKKMVDRIEEFILELEDEKDLF